MKKLFLFFILIFCLANSALLAAAAEAEDNFDISTAKLGVMTGSTGEAYATQHCPDADIRSYADIMDAVAALSAGKLDAVVTSDVSAMSIVKSDPSMMIDGGRLVDETVSIVVDKGNEELLKQFNDIITELKADGTLADMEKRWMEADEPEYVEIPLADGPVLKVSLTATRAPFSYKDSNGDIIGFSPELAYRAGQKMGRRIEFVVTEFAAMIPAVKSGKSDAIIDLLVYTDERAKSVDFSEVYYISGQVLLRKAPGAAEASWQSKFSTGFTNNLLTENRWKMLIDGIGVTMIISFSAFALATVIGFALCLMSMSEKNALNGISRVYLYVIRGTPMVVLLMVAFYIIFAKSNMSGVAVAAIAFGLNSGAAISVIFKTAIETVDNGQVEAARSMGFGRIGAFIYITAPQAIKVAFPTYKSEFISLFKGTAIVGYIAVVDLTKAGDFIRAKTFDPFFPLIIVALIYMAAITVILMCFDAIFRMSDKRSRRENQCSK